MAAGQMNDRQRYEHHYLAALRALEARDFDEAQVHATLAHAAATARVSIVIDRIPCGDS
jgi:hypothetical protein